MLTSNKSHESVKSNQNTLVLAAYGQPLPANTTGLVYYTVCIWTAKVFILKDNVIFKNWVLRARTFLPRSPILSAGSAWEIVYHNKKIHFIGGTDAFAYTYDFSRNAWFKTTNTPLCFASFISTEQGIFASGGHVPALIHGTRLPQTQLLSCPKCYKGVIKMQYFSKMKNQQNDWNCKPCNFMCNSCEIRVNELSKKQFFPYYLNFEDKEVAVSTDTYLITTNTSTRESSLSDFAAERRVGSTNMERVAHTMVAHEGDYFLVSGEWQKGDSPSNDQKLLTIEIIAGTSSSSESYVVCPPNGTAFGAGHFSLVVRHQPQGGGTYSFMARPLTILEHLSIFSKKITMAPVQPINSKDAKYQVKKTLGANSKEYLDYIYIGGGENDENAKRVERFSITRSQTLRKDDPLHTRTSIGFCEELPRMKESRAYASAFVLRGLENRVYVFGGVEPRTMRPVIKGEYLDFFSSEGWQYADLVLPSHKLSYFRVFCIDS